MTMSLKRRKLTICEKVKMIQEVETNPTTIPGKASTTEEKSCGAHSGGRGNFLLHILNEQGAVHQ
jgi:hypothetical protein